MIDLLEGITTSNLSRVRPTSSLHWNDWPAWRDYDCSVDVIHAHGTNHWNDWPAWRDYDHQDGHRPATLKFQLKWLTCLKGLRPRRYDPPASDSVHYWNDWPAWRDYDSTPALSNAWSLSKLKWLTCLKGLRLTVLVITETPFWDWNDWPAWRDYDLRYLS